MKVLFVHNQYGSSSGEEIMIGRITDLLRGHGHEVLTYFQSSETISNSIVRKASAFFSGFHSFRSCRELSKILDDACPDIVQVQNLYPLISPGILPLIRERGIPIVMRCANYRLICPNGLLMTKGEVCERCSSGQEWWCILRNCEGSVAKSVGYAMRNWYARCTELYKRNVSHFIAQTRFQKGRLVAHGLPEKNICVIPNMINPEGGVDTDTASDSDGAYVAYVGRLSPEKGVTWLLEAARALGHIPFKAAGAMGNKHLRLHVPENFELCGHCAGEELADFYRASRVVVVPSICYEGFPSVLLEAMVYRKPVVCSDIGGLPEIVIHNVTGHLVPPGDVEALTTSIAELWQDPLACQQMGDAGRQRVLREYSPEMYYKRLMDLYKTVVEGDEKRR